MQPFKFATTLMLIVLGAVGAAAASSTLPVYPGAMPGALPNGVAFKEPPSQVKAYSTSDSFTAVKAWYRAHLNGAPEMHQTGMEQSEDAFLIGHGASAQVIMIRSFKGKTWILIGPAI